MSVRPYDPPALSGKGGLRALFGGIFCVVALGIVLLVLSGCGYSLNHRIKDVFRTPRGVFVPIFTNNTEETGVERYFTNALIRELQSRGEIVVGTREEGAAELHGTIDTISYAPTAFTSTGYQGLSAYRRLPLEFGLSATITLRLIDPGTRRIVWSGSFSSFRRVAAPVDRTYNFQAPSSVGMQAQTTLESRYQDISRDVSRDAYDGMVELF